MGRPVQDFTTVGKCRSARIDHALLNSYSNQIDSLRGVDNPLLRGR